MPARLAIIRRGPGPLFTGCAGAGGSLLTNWDGGPDVEPRPKPVLEQVGGHQRQPPTAYLPDDRGDPRKAEQDGNRHPHLGRPHGGVAVCAV